MLLELLVLRNLLFNIDIQNVQLSFSDMSDVYNYFKLRKNSYIFPFLSKLKSMIWIKQPW